jgi:hypothetical protein
MSSYRITDKPHKHLKIVHKRTLTGKWYLKKTFLGNYKLMVEVERSMWCDPTYGNGGASYSPKRVLYEEAKGSDSVNLGIDCA